MRGTENGYAVETSEQASLNMDFVTDLPESTAAVCDNENFRSLSKSRLEVPSLPRSMEYPGQKGTDRHSCATLR